MSKPERQESLPPPGGPLVAAARAFVAVGSNIDPETHIPAALLHLQQAVELVATSTFFRSAPLNRPDQPLFYNGVWQINTLLEPGPLKFDLLRSIEDRLGRQRSDDRHEARTMDLDLVLYEDRIMDHPDLRIPDPDILERPFIAVPLLELAPDVVIPGTDRPLSHFGSACNGADLIPLTEFTQRLRLIMEQATSVDT